MGNVFTAGIPPLFSLLIEEFHCSTNEAAHLTTYALLMLGVAVSRRQRNLFEVCDAKQFCG